jgi:hypothetical protein
MDTASRPPRILNLEEKLLSSAGGRLGDAAIAKQLADTAAGVLSGFQEKLEASQAEASSTFESEKSKQKRLETAAIRALNQRIDELQRELDIARVSAARMLATHEALRRDNQRLSGDIKNMLSDRENSNHAHAEALGAARAAAAAAEMKAKAAIAEAAEHAAEDASSARANVTEQIKVATEAMGIVVDPAAATRRALHGVAILLENERRTTRELRDELAAMRRNRSQAELLLHAAIRDAGEAHRSKAHQKQEGAHGDASAVSAHSRAAALTAILHREEVLAALPKIVFGGVVKEEAPK